MSLVDMIFILVMIPVVVVCAILGFFILDQVGSAWTFDGAHIFTMASDQIGFWDTIIVFMLVGTLITALIISWAVDAMPITVFVFWFVTVLSVFLSGVMGDWFNQVITHPMIIAVSSQFPYSILIVSNLPIVMLSFSTIGTILLLAKGKSSKGMFT